MTIEEHNQKIAATKRLFFAMKGENADRYESSHGFSTPDGKMVCCFKDKINNWMK